MIKFSIVTSTYQAGALIGRAAASVREQTWPNKEWLVADGGSTDDTLAELERNRDVVTWFGSEPDRGIMDGWNKALAHATGDWIYVMGADDRLAAPDVLEAAAARLEKLPPSCLLAYGSVDMVRSDGGVAETLGRPWDPFVFRSVCMNIPHQGTFHRRELFERYGLFDIEDRSTGTYEMLLRYLKDHDAAFLPDFKVGLMQLEGVSSLPGNQLKFYQAYVKAQKRHGTYHPNTKLMFRLLQARIKERLAATLGPERTVHLVDLSRRLIGKRPIGT